MTGLSRNVVRDMQKILTRQKMQLQALDDGEDIPDDRTDVMDLPHLFKPTSAGLHDAARTLRANPLPAEEPGIPVPGAFGPVDRLPTEEELEAGVARLPGPHPVRAFGGFIEPPELVEQRERDEAEARERKEERPERRTRNPEQKADAKRGKGNDVTEQDAQKDMVEAQEAQERQRRIDEAEADKKRLEEQTKREQELSRQANPQQAQQAQQPAEPKAEPKKAQGR